MFRALRLQFQWVWIPRLAVLCLGSERVYRAPSTTILKPSRYQAYSRDSEIAIC